jgi:hypothetical protein
MISNLRSVLAVIGLTVLRCGVPIVGIWLLGAVLKHAVGTQKDRK